MGDDSGDAFYNALQQYTKVDKIESQNLDAVVASLNSYSSVIIGFHKSNLSPWKAYQFSNKELVWLQEIASQNKVILSVFTKPYALNALKSLSNIESILLAYQNSEISQRVAAQIIFGALPAKGKLPVSISNSSFKVGQGIQTQPLG